MPALQVRDPVEPFILVKSDDLPVQNASSPVSMRARNKVLAINL
jgi:hypothetical protein